MVQRRLQLIYPQTRIPRLARNRRAARSARATGDASQQLRQKWVIFPRAGGLAITAEVPPATESLFAIGDLHR